MRCKKDSRRDQLELFRALPGDLAPYDAEDLVGYPFFSLAKTTRIASINFRGGGALSSRDETWIAPGVSCHSRLAASSLSAVGPPTTLGQSFRGSIFCA